MESRELKIRWMRYAHASNIFKVPSTTEADVDALCGWLCPPSS